MRMLYCRSNRLVKHYCPYFWTQYWKTTLSNIRVAYNNAYRKILWVSRRASASGMFVSNDIPNFFNLFSESQFIRLLLDYHLLLIS